ncbi:hypothetical protein AC249_AIPGENE1348 [Exaiptasia diaphana]|nr:hypothetical protein AC249_AIPGENE1348 [Exaiptasia diaphana]
MGNCQVTETWMPNIGKPYVVRLERLPKSCGWCGEDRELFINDVKMENFALPQPTCSNSCSPLCGPDVSFAWEDHGHRFLLQFNSITCCSEKYYRLFVDGVDVGTGLGFSAYFKRQGFIRLVAALIFFILLGGVCKFQTKSEVENQAAPSSWPEAYRSTTTDGNIA